MDERLESVDKILAVGIDDPQRELAFAMLAAVDYDAATLNWLAACAVARAAEIDD